MRVGVFRGVRRIEVEEAPEPVAGERDVVIDVKACGICGSDLHTYLEGALVEVPVTWALDDWPHFEPSAETGRDGLSAPSKVLEIWTEELRYAHAHAPGGLLTVTMHPECIGRGHRMAMLERFIDAAAALEGVVFDRLDRYVDRWLVSS